MNKSFQNKTRAAAAVLYQGVQFSVRKGTGSSLSKLRVGVWIKFSFRPKPCDRFLSFFYRLSPLINDGTKPGSCKEESREHTGRPETDNHRPVFFLLKILFPRYSLYFQGKLRSFIAHRCCENDIFRAKLFHKLLFIYPF